MNTSTVKAPVFSARHDRLVLKLNGRFLFVPTDEIWWIGAEGNYIRVHTGARSHLVHARLYDIEGLMPDTLVRIHRSTVVNVTKIQEIHVGHGRRYEVVLGDDTRLSVSRRFRDKLRQFL